MCDWVISPQQEYFEGCLENETEQQTKLREIRRKLSDLIDRFDSRLKDDKSNTEHSLEHTSDATNLVPATITSISGVMYGSSKPDFKRYGLGFWLTFFDKINECELALFICKEKMEKYHYCHHLDTELKRSDMRYINFYFIPEGISMYENKSVQTVYNIDDLYHLVLVIESK